MNRLVQYLNFFGVLVLVAICVVQWQRNRALNLEVNQLIKTHQEESQKISEQAKNIAGLTSDLAILKDQISQTHSNLTEARATSRNSESQIDQLQRERDQLKESVTNWANAVEIRDQRIKESNEQMLVLSQQLNDSIRKYNALVTNYNSVVKQMDDVRKRLESAASQTPTKTQ